MVSSPATGGGHHRRIFQHGRIYKYLHLTEQVLSVVEQTAVLHRIRKICYGYVRRLIYGSVCIRREHYVVRLLYELLVVADINRVIVSCIPAGRVGQRIVLPYHAGQTAVIPKRYFPLSYCKIPCRPVVIHGCIDLNYPLVRVVEAVENEHAGSVAGSTNTRGVSHIAVISCVPCCAGSKPVVGSGCAVQTEVKQVVAVYSNTRYTPVDHPRPAVECSRRLGHAACRRNVHRDVPVAFCYGVAYVCNRKRVVVYEIWLRRSCLIRREVYRMIGYKVKVKVRLICEVERI